MGVEKLYIATNQVTGEVIKGTSKELSDRFNITRASICHYVDRESKANGMWLITYPIQSAEKKSIWQEWDDFTEPIRQYMKRRKRK